MLAVDMFTQHEFFQIGKYIDISHVIPGDVPVSARVCR